jgi:hypothetical protein
MSFTLPLGYKVQPGVQARCTKRLICPRLFDPDYLMWNNNRQYEKTWFARKVLFDHEQ